MSQIAVCSVKGAPGATTLALALTCALAHAGGEAALVEGDPAGGDLAALIGLSTDPGMASLAAASRHHSARLDARSHGQRLPAGGWALLGSTDPTQATATLVTLVSRLRHALEEASQHAVIDCGRWATSSPISPLLHEVTTTVCCLPATVPAIEAVRVRVDKLREATGGRVGLVVIGPDRYGPDQIGAATGVPVMGSIPWDERGCSGLLGAAKSRVERSPLVRAARSLIDRLDTSAPIEPRRPAVTVPDGLRS